MNLILDLPAETRTTSSGSSRSRPEAQRSPAGKSFSESMHDQMSSTADTGKPRQNLPQNGKTLPDSPPDQPSKPNSPTNLIRDTQDMVVRDTQDVTQRNLLEDPLLVSDWTQKGFAQDTQDLLRDNQSAATLFQGAQSLVEDNLRPGVNDLVFNSQLDSTRLPEGVTGLTIQAVEIPIVSSVLAETLIGGTNPGNVQSLVGLQSGRPGVDETLLSLAEQSVDPRSTMKILGLANARPGPAASELPSTLTPAIAMSDGITTEVTKRAQLITASLTAPLNQDTQVSLISAVMEVAASDLDNNRQSGQQFSFTAPPASAADVQKPPSLPVLSTPAGQPGWDAEVGSKIRWMVGGDVKSAEIRLNPQSLGTLEIRVATDEEGTRVTFFTQNQQARELMENSLPRLREIFAAAGLTLGEAEVNDRSMSDNRDEASRFTTEWQGLSDEMPVAETGLPADQGTSYEAEGFVDTFI